MFFHRQSAACGSHDKEKGCGKIKVLEFRRDILSSMTMMMLMMTTIRMIRWCRSITKTTASLATQHFLHVFICIVSNIQAWWGKNAQVGSGRINARDVTPPHTCS